AGLAVYRRALDQERLPATGLLHLVVRQRADLQFSGKGFTDAPEFTGFVKVLDPVAERIEGHGGTLGTTPREVTRPARNAAGIFEHVTTNGGGGQKLPVPSISSVLSGIFV